MHSCTYSPPVVAAKTKRNTHKKVGSPVGPARGGLDGGGLVGDGDGDDDDSEGSSLSVVVLSDIEDGAGGGGGGAGSGGVGKGHHSKARSEIDWTSILVSKGGSGDTSGGAGGGGGGGKKSVQFEAGVTEADGNSVSVELQR